MSSGEDHEKLRILFLAACELEAREQEAFLDFVCGDDHSLRSQLEALLREDPGPDRVAGDPLLSKVGELIDRQGEQFGADRVSLHGDVGPGDPRATQKIVLSPSEHRYAKIEQIAEGGMGVILKVWDREFNRPLAMKMILRRSGSPSDQLDSLAVARFLEEAQVTGQLDHPGVVAVHQLGLDEKTGLFFTMDLVEGRTLEEIVQLASRQEEGWNQTKILRVLIRVCETLGYAHSRGVIHRDVKPRNIMVGGFGETYVMDWGLAKVVGRKDLHDLRLEPRRDRSEASIHTHRTDRASDDHLSPLITVDGTVLGTPSYMPPEQAEGRVEQLDVRSDVYAVGAMLYEVLTGQMPYVRPGARTTPHAVLEAVTKGPPTSVHKINPAVPQELGAICDKAMARDKALRYPSSLDVAHDLQAFLDHRVVKAYKTGAVAELKSWVARNRSTAVAGAIAGLLLVAVAVVACVGYLQTNEALRGEALQREETTKNLYHSLVREARTLRLARKTGYRSQVWQRLRDALDLETPARDLDELRLEAMGCLGDFAGLEPVVWSEFPDPIRSIAFDSEANQLALGLYSGDVSLRELRSAAESALLEAHEKPVSALSFGPGGEILVSGDEGGTIKIWERRSDEAWVPSRTISYKPILSLIVVPDGNRVAVLSYLDPEIRMWNLATATWGAEFLVPENETRCMAVSSDGKLLAASFVESGTTGVALWNTDNSQGPPRVTRPRMGMVHALSFSQDGRYLACGSEQGIEVLQTDSLQHYSFVRGDLSSSVAFGPDSHLLAFVSQQLNLVQLWNVTSNEQVVALVDPGSRRRAHTLLFSHDGEVLISPTHETVRFWNLAGADEVDSLSGHDGGIPGVAFSPDGRLLASASKDQTVRIWDVSRTETARTLTGFRAPVQTVAFHPDGRRLATADWSGDVKIWDVSSGTKLTHVEHELGGQTWVVAFSPDGEYFVLASMFGAGIWDVEPRRGNAGGQGTLHFERIPDIPLELTRSLCFSPDSSTVAWIEHHDRTIEAWDLVNARALPTAEARATFDLDNLAFFPDSRRLVYINAEQAVEVYDAITGESKSSFGGPNSEAPSRIDLGNQVALSPDGAWLACGNPGRSVSLWDTRRGRWIGSLPDGTGTAWCFRWSPDGERLAVGFSDGKLALWSIPRIRAHLRELGLDWEEPATPRADRAGF